MSYNATLRQHELFVRLTVHGLPTYEEVLDLVRTFAADSRNWSPPLLFIDARGVQSTFSRAQQFRIGAFLASALEGVERIASLVPSHRLTRISEKGAIGRGAALRVFAELADAVSWLEEVEGNAHRFVGGAGHQASGRTVPP